MIIQTCQTTIYKCCWIILLQSCITNASVFHRDNAKTEKAHQWRKSPKTKTADVTTLLRSCASSFFRDSCSLSRAFSLLLPMSLNTTWLTCRHHTNNGHQQLCTAQQSTWSPICNEDQYEGSICPCPVLHSKRLMLYKSCSHWGTTQNNNKTHFLCNTTMQMKAETLKFYNHYLFLNTLSSDGCVTVNTKQSKHPQKSKKHKNDLPLYQAWLTLSFAFSIMDLAASMSCKRCLWCSMRFCMDRLYSLRDLLLPLLPPGPVQEPWMKLHRPLGLADTKPGKQYMHHKYSVNMTTWVGWHKTRKTIYMHRYSVNMTAQVGWHKTRKTIYAS